MEIKVEFGKHVAGFDKLPGDIRMALFVEHVMEVYHAGDHWMRSFYRAGIEVLDNGCYGAVIQPPLSVSSNKVVKVSFEEDDSYPYFVQAILDGEFTEGTDHLPVIHYADRIGGVFVCVMEHLDELHGSLHDVADEARDVAYQGRYTEGDTAPLAALIKQLREWAGLFGYSWDLHMGNFMCRGGTVIVTDPVSRNQNYTGPEVLGDQLNQIELELA